MTEQQKYYQNNFNRKLGPSRDTLSVDLKVSLRKKYYDVKEQRHRLVPVVDDPLEVLKVKALAVFLRLGFYHMGKSHNWIVKVPVTRQTYKKVARNDEIPNCEVLNDEQGSSEIVNQQKSTGKIPNTTQQCAHATMCGSYKKRYAVIEISYPL